MADTVTVKTGSRKIQKGLKYPENRARTFWGKKCGNVKVCPV